MEPSGPLLLRPETTRTVVLSRQTGDLAYEANKRINNLSQLLDSETNTEMRQLLKGEKENMIKEYNRQYYYQAIRKGDYDFLKTSMKHFNPLYIDLSVWDTFEQIFYDDSEEVTAICSFYSSFFKKISDNILTHVLSKNLRVDILSIINVSSVKFTFSAKNLPLLEKYFVNGIYTFLINKELLFQNEEISDDFVDDLTDYLLLLCMKHKDILLKWLCASFAEDF